MPAYVRNEDELLAIIEFGGYPDFSPLYRSAGYSPVVVNSMREALKYLKKKSPRLIVTEFNYQSAFRDRLSSLESLIAVVQRRPEINVIVFYDNDFLHQFKRLEKQYQFYFATAYPIDSARLETVLSTLR